jgi:hypothetical protein
MLSSYVTLYALQIKELGDDYWEEKVDSFGELDIFQTNIGVYVMRYNQATDKSTICAYGDSPAECRKNYVRQCTENANLMHSAWLKYDK